MGGAQLPIELVLLDSEEGELERASPLLPNPLAELLGPWTAGQRLRISLDGLPPEGLEGSLFLPDRGEEGSPSTLTLPADAYGALSVGACDEGGPARYSSAGPTEDGRLLPQLCASGRLSPESTDPCGFVGTSASAPLVTGAAAALASSWTLPGRGAPPDPSPAELGQMLVEGALPFAEGWDAQAGQGRLQLGWGCACQASPPPRLPVLALLLLAFLRRIR
jgi:MYXO-CTERM domain-containing protein